MARGRSAKKSKQRHRKKTTAPQTAMIDVAGGTAELIREADPEGATVVHAVRRDGTVVDRLFRAGSLGDTGAKLHQGGERFRKDFERGRLMGHFGSVDLLRGSTGPGRQEMLDTVVLARQRINYALGALGYVPGAGHGSMLGKAAWWVIGEQVSLEDFSWRMRSNGAVMSEGKAAGLVIGALERLAVHYQLIEVHDAGRAAHSHARAAGLCDAARRLEQRAATARIMAAGAKTAFATAKHDGGVPLERLRELRRESIENSAKARVLIEMARDLEQAGRRGMGLRGAEAAE